MISLPGLEFPVLPNSRMQNYFASTFVISKETQGFGILLTLVRDDFGSTRETEWSTSHGSTSSLAWAFSSPLDMMSSKQC